ncbi:MAG TPA: hypothetical protein VEK57_13265 [Thermoanaerobaculia bacterium]|nr:hypothetical protein [Thermoanaerobaculia bacterium]
MRKAAWLGTALALAAAAAVPGSASEKIVDDTAMAEVFNKACLQPGTEQAIRAQVAADGGWSKAEVDPSLTIGSRKDPKTYDAFSRTVDGKQLQLVLVKFPKRSSEFMCVLLVPDVPNMMPYLDAFRSAAKAAGLKGYETDLPHLFRTKGRLASGIKAQSDLFSRSPFLPGQKAMHMVLMY